MIMRGIQKKLRGKMCVLIMKSQRMKKGSLNLNWSLKGHFFLL